MFLMNNLSLYKASFLIDVIIDIHNHSHIECIYRIIIYESCIYNMLIIFAQYIMEYERYFIILEKICFHK